MNLMVLTYKPVKSGKYYHISKGTVDLQPFTAIVRPSYVGWFSNNVVMFIDMYLLNAGNLMSFLASAGILFHNCGPLNEKAHLPSLVLLRGTAILALFAWRVYLPVTVIMGTKKPDKLERPSKYIDL